MSGTTISRTALATAVAVAALLAAATTAGARSHDATFDDPAADSNGAPDIQSVTVSDDADGKLVFRITTDQPTRPSGSGLLVDVNADRDLKTGGYNDGIDYVFGLDDGGFEFARVTQAGTLVTKAPGASGTWQNGVATLTVNRRDLGGTSGFTFFVASALSSSPRTQRDDAPNLGLWSYTTTHATVVRLTASKVIGFPVGSGLYSAGMLVQRSDTGGFVGKEGKLQCAAQIGATALTARISRFMAMTYEGTKITPGMCAWSIPAGSSGKTIRGTITASYAGATVTRSFSGKIA